MDITLTQGVRVRVSRVSLVRQDYEIYRVTLEFISDQPDKGRVIKDYYIWLSTTFVDDFLHITRQTTEEDVQKVALTLAKKRFSAMGEVPPEEGLDVSNEGGLNRLADARNYVHPIERQQ